LTLTVALTTGQHYRAACDVDDRGDVVSPVDWHLANLQLSSLTNMLMSTSSHVCLEHTCARSLISSLIPISSKYHKNWARVTK